MLVRATLLGCWCGSLSIGGPNISSLTPLVCTVSNQSAVANSNEKIAMLTGVTTGTCKVFAVHSTGGVLALLSIPITVKTSANPVALYSGHVLLQSVLIDGVASGVDTITIAKATLTVTPTSGQSIVYGSVDPTFTWTAMGYQNGDDSVVVSGALSRDTGSNVGSYAYSIGTLKPSTNYTLSLSASSPTFAITPDTLLIQPDLNQSRTYGFSPSGNQLKYSIASSTPWQLKDGSSLFTGNLNVASPYVGNQKITMGSLSAGPNYTLSFGSNSYSVQITPATLTVTTNTQAKLYGSLVNLTIMPAVSKIQITRATGDNENVGNHELNVTAISNSANYTLTFVNGVLTITPAPLTLVVENDSVSDGQTPNVSAHFVGLANGDDAQDVAICQVSASYQGLSVDTISNVSCRRGAKSEDYTLTKILAGQLTVLPGLLQITTSSQNPDSIVSVNGLAPWDSLQALSIQTDSTGAQVVLYDGKAVSKYRVEFAAEATSVLPQISYKTPSPSWQNIAGEVFLQNLRGSVRVCDLQGRVWFSGTALQNSLNLSLPAGHYVVITSQGALPFFTH